MKKLVGSNFTYSPNVLILICILTSLLNAQNTYGQINPGSSCAGASSLASNSSCSSNTFGISGTTGDATPTCGGGIKNDGYYSFTATANYTSIDWTYSKSFSIAIYDACGGSEIACTSGSSGTLDLGTSSGNTYIIHVVHDGGGGTGNGSICVYETPPGDGSSCSSANFLTPGTQQCGTNSYAGDFDDGGSSPLNPCQSSYSDGEYWFSYFGTGDQLQLDVSGLTASYSGLFVFDACPGSSPNCIASYTSGSSTADFSITTSILTSGQLYYIVLANWASPYSTDFCLDATEITPPPPPANDECSGSTLITINTSSSCTNITSGTAEDARNSGISGCTGQADDDVWFRFVASASDHNIELSNITGTTDLVHEVFEGSCGSLTSIGCSDPNSSSISGLTAGQVYYIRVYTSAAGGGNTGFDICVSTPPAPGPACYTETRPGFNFYGKNGDNITFPDDQHDIIRDIGFDFCFMGTTYSQFVVSSNGYITFRTSNTGTWSEYDPEPIPNTLDDVLASILGPWHDINPDLGGRIRTKLRGNSPNQQRIITFDGVPMYSCTSIDESHEIILYETSNIIDINLEDKDICAGWVGGRATMGLNGPYGLVAVPAAGRNNTVWSQIDETVRFTPTCDVCSPAAILSAFRNSFTGEHKEGKHFLYWESDDNIDIKNYVIERSQDGVHYQELDQIRRNKGISDYTYTDDTALPGISYYRIREEKQDGSFQYSRAISLTMDLTSRPFIFPNPAKDFFIVSFELDERHSDYRFELINANGVLVKQVNGQDKFGKHELVIPTIDMKKGLYFYRMRLNGQMHSGKLVIN